MSISLQTPAPATDTEPVVTGPATKAGRSRSFWSEVWRRFRRNKLAMLALLFVVGLTVVAILSPAIAGTKPVVVRYKGNFYFPALGYFNRSWENPIFYKDRFRMVYPKNLQEKDPDHWVIWPLVFQDPYRRVGADEWPGKPANETVPPNRINLFGTNQSGVDVFAQIVHGTRTALLVGFVSMGIAASIGILIGAVAGYFGGWLDIALSRFIEVVMCIPTLILVLALLSMVSKPTIWHMMAVLGATGWTGIARLTRGEFIKLRQMEFITAARALGARPFRIMLRHVLPNALAPVLVPITFGIAGAILVESALSFLGFGAPPPTASWGSLLRDGKDNLNLWWLVLFPGTAIFLAVLAYNLIGEGLQEATDPRLREASK